MKTIAILTDFSERSVHAARYALHMAQKINASVLVFNAFSVPADRTLATGQITPVLHSYKGMRQDAEHRLKNLCAQLEQELRSESKAEDALPAISWQCEEGPVTAALLLLEQNKELVLLVAATHNAGASRSFIPGNHCRALIDAARLPLLLVPDHAPVADLDKITFATDLNRGDIGYINAVAGLAEAFNAYITIVNVDPEEPSDTEHNQRVNAFMQDMVLQVGYRHICYRNFPDRRVNKGLTAVLEKDQPDLLVMVHRQVQASDLLFSSSHTQNLADQVALPLLVYPFPMADIPTFLDKPGKTGHGYYRYFRVDQKDTTVRVISANDLQAWRSKSPGAVTLQPGAEKYWLFTDIGRAMEKAKAGARAYIEGLIARGEEGRPELLQYRMDHYEDLNINLIEANIEKVKREMQSHSDFVYKPYKINPNNISDDYKRNLRLYAGS
ncbi:universal stress protein [Mucilaginibacter sp. SMC90]|uniref:universal stress protein n=1 Tax=Mucilaginibacter sp. SMC90 TaxID=2929803 RepID=UPI001FB4C477|nr:universal stress protein [Mucilaginibacter sp. SMC90]UOE49803.1 universal stress protein [Mucilaginibacter sp. SMC90]